ncbi:MAG: hypothetical protein HC938_14145 [Nitrospira sp.]|nr:hypothetical protein [Nitrospira sp.]
MPTPDVDAYIYAYPDRMTDQLFRQEPIKVSGGSDQGSERSDGWGGLGRVQLMV